LVIKIEIEKKNLFLLLKKIEIEREEKRFLFMENMKMNRNFYL